MRNNRPGGTGSTLTEQKEMMSLAQIADLSDEQAERAAKRGSVPFMVWAEDLPRWKSGKPLPFPNIGSYEPPGWREVRRLFCDKSGFGGPGELALTMEEMLDQLKPGMGYAIVEEGQFQIYLGEFEKVAFADVRLSA